MNNEDVGRAFVIKQATTLSALWPELSYQARQDIIKEIVEHIEVGKEALHFVIHHMPNLSQNYGETLADFPL